MSCVAIQHGCVAVGDLARVVEDDDLGSEIGRASRGVVLGVTCDVTTAQLLHGDVLDVETNVVSGDSFRESFVVHLDRFDFSSQIGGSEGDHHAGLEYTGFNSTHWYGTDTTDFVDILRNLNETMMQPFNAPSVFFYNFYRAFRGNWERQQLE